MHFHHITAGVALTGCGLSTLIPTVFITGGRTPGIDSTVAIARLSVFTNLGSVAGPPLIGLASTSLRSLRCALFFQAGLLSAIIYFSFGIVDVPALSGDSTSDNKSDIDFKKDKQVFYPGDDPDNSSLNVPLLM